MKLISNLAALLVSVLSGLAIAMQSITMHRARTLLYREALEGLKICWRQMPGNVRKVSWNLKQSKHRTPAFAGATN